MWEKVRSGAEILDLSLTMMVNVGNLNHGRLLGRFLHVLPLGLLLTVRRGYIFHVFVFEVSLALLLLVPGSKPESKRFVCNMFMNNKALSSVGE